VQIHLGFVRALGLHVPLGVLVLAGSAWQFWWVWRRDPAGRVGGARGRVR
jgi:hypothetical protein